MKKSFLLSVFVFSFIFLSAQNNFSSKNKYQFAQKQNIQAKSSPKAQVWCNKQDSLALLSLFNSTAGYGWKEKTGWPNGYVSSRYGVTLNSSGRVISLDLSDNNLIGSIPSDIGNLTGLTELFLNGNQISGSIPTEIGNLTQLQYLHLDNNKLTGSIPSSIGNLKDLKNLYLNKNNLSGEIPTSIGNLSSLELFLVSGNQLTGSIPSSIGNLANLTNLSLFSNKLSGSIPSSIENLANLQELSIYGNELSGNIPGQIGNLKQLQSIDLSNNQLSGTIPSSIGNLTNLQSLKLYSNQLSGAIPSSIANLTNLTILYLDHNNFDSLPDLSALSKLDYCHLQNNNFDFGDLQTADIKPSQYYYSPQANIGDTSYFKYIEGNDYSFYDSVGGTGNQYQWYKDGNAISGQTNKTLNITNASITDTGTYYCEITNSSFSSLTLRTNDFHLKVYYTVNFTVKDVNLQTIENAQIIVSSPATTTDTLKTDATGKQSIDLRTENYKAITSKKGFIKDTVSFSVEKSEKNITIYLNSVCNVQDSLSLIALYDSTDGEHWNDKKGWLTAPVCKWQGIWLNSDGKVYMMDLSQINLSGRIPPQIGNFSDLKELELSDNNITGSIPPEIGKLSNLQYLRLREDHFSGKIPPEICNLKRLKSFDAKNNNLSGSIPSEIGNIDSLTYLGLQNNNLSGSIPPEIGKIRSLKVIQLQNNKLSGSIPPEIGNLSFMQTISLYHNQLTGAVPPEITKLKELRNLFLYENQLDSLPDLSALNNMLECDVYSNNFDFGDLQTANISANFYSYSPQHNIGNTTYLKFTEGNDYSFYDSVGGSGNQYQWFKDGNAISGQTNKTLNITNASITDTGTYYCQITNSAFNKLTLQTEPFILDTGVYTVHFTVTDINSQPIKNAKIIINDDAKIYTDNSGTKKLELANGSYSAIVSKNGFVNDTANFSIKYADKNINITLQTVTAITRKTKSNILIYPNPVSDNFFVKNAENSMMTITDICGRNILRKKLDTNRQNINITNLPSGIYIINITLKKSIFRTKIIKK
jgi:Leucine-rich repeat (LRR) protein